MGKILNLIRYNLRGYNKITEAEITYTLYTKAGESILSIEETIRLDKPIITFKEWNLFSQFFKKNNEERFNKRAKEILDEYRAKKKIKLGVGAMVTGDYIVKCIWEGYMNYRKITFKEYLEYKNET